MALIKCPECGREVSDRAPFCPHCGIEIAGKITVEQARPIQPVVTEEPVRMDTPQTPTEPTTPPSDENTPKKKSKSRTPIVMSFILSAIICALCVYFYNNAKSQKEIEAYEYAMSSVDAQILEDYLFNYPDAPQAHRDSIDARLDWLKLGDQEWNTALVNGTRAALMAYIDGHPNSLHLTEARHLVDSIDWAKAQTDDEALELYISEHGQGEHIDDAMQLQKKHEALKVSDADRQMIFHLFDSFFTSITQRDESLLTSTLNALMDDFLGKKEATKGDVLTWLSKIYKEDINSMNWVVNNDYKIVKKAVENAIDGNEEYEYTVNFSVDQKIDRSDTSKDTFVTYKISAKVTPDLKITDFNMTRINN